MVDFEGGRLSGWVESFDAARNKAYEEPEEGEKRLIWWADWKPAAKIVYARVEPVIAGRLSLGKIIDLRARGIAD